MAAGMATRRVREGGTRGPAKIPGSLPGRWEQRTRRNFPAAARPEGTLLPPRLRQRLRPPPRPAPEAAPPGEAAAAEAESQRIASHRRARRDLPGEGERDKPGAAAAAPGAWRGRAVAAGRAHRLGKKHDQDELQPADHLHCSDCFLWLCLLLSEDKPLLS
ncbi:CD59 glycoprotein isoform X1 [Haemorhous mexicanus]|uniref:CD59 glycoprotein isoform X1 n=1 Tax=Haemorhous mexicanus TaxID=30427 RepID=UPI0028BDB6CF|nr:CD59 glycoprotein isoform X1 [Haemorhous mexicanus]